MVRWGAQRSCKVNEVKVDLASKAADVLPVRTLQRKYGMEKARKGAKRQVTEGWGGDELKRKGCEA